MSGDAHLTSNILQPAMDYKITELFLINKLLVKKIRNIFRKKLDLFIKY